MRFLKMLGFMILGAAVMMACLLWVSQFFNLEDDTTPVIWIQDAETANSSKKDPLQPDFAGDR